MPNANPNAIGPNTTIFHHPHWVCEGSCWVRKGFHGDIGREFTSWLLREGQNVGFAVITIAAQTFPDIFGSPSLIFIIFVSLNSYLSRLNLLKFWLTLRPKWRRS